MTARAITDPAMIAMVTIATATTRAVMIMMGI